MSAMYDDPRPWWQRLLHRHHWRPELYGCSCWCGHWLVCPGLEEYLPAGKRGPKVADL